MSCRGGHFSVCAPHRSSVTRPSRSCLCKPACVCARCAAVADGSAQPSQCAGHALDLVRTLYVSSVVAALVPLRTGAQRLAPHQGRGAARSMFAVRVLPNHRGTPAVPRDLPPCGVAPLAATLASRCAAARRSRAARSAQHGGAVCAVPWCACLGTASRTMRGVVVVVVCVGACWDAMRACQPHAGAGHRAASTQACVRSNTDTRCEWSFRRRT